MDRVAAARVERLQRDAVAAARRVVPVDAVAIVERAHDLAARAFRQRGQEPIGGGAHAGGRGRAGLGNVVGGHHVGDRGKENADEDAEE